MVKDAWRTPSRQAASRQPASLPTVPETRSPASSSTHVPCTTPAHLRPSGSEGTLGTAVPDRWVTPRRRSTRRGCNGAQESGSEASPSDSDQSTSAHALARDRNITRRQRRPLSARAPSSIAGVDDIVTGTPAKSRSTSRSQPGTAARFHDSSGGSQPEKRSTSQSQLSSATGVDDSNAGPQLRRRSASQSQTSSAAAVDEGIAGTQPKKRSASQSQLKGTAMRQQLAEMTKEITLPADVVQDDKSLQEEPQMGCPSQSAGPQPKKRSFSQSQLKGIAMRQQLAEMTKDITLPADVAKDDKSLQEEPQIDCCNQSAGPQPKKRSASRSQLKGTPMRQQLAEMTKEITLPVDVAKDDKSLQEEPQMDCPSQSRGIAGPQPQKRSVSQSQLKGTPMRQQLAEMTKEITLPADVAKDDKSLQEEPQIDCPSQSAGPQPKKRSASQAQLKGTSTRQQLAEMTKEITLPVDVAKDDKSFQEEPQTDCPSQSAGPQPKKRSASRSQLKGTPMRQQLAEMTQEITLPVDSAKEDKSLQEEPQTDCPSQSSGLAAQRSASAPARTQDRLNQQQSQTKDSKHSPRSIQSSVGKDALTSQHQSVLCKQDSQASAPSAPSSPNRSSLNEATYESSRESSAAQVRAASVRPSGSFDRNVGVMPCNRAIARHTRHLASARGPAARAAFREALVSGVHQPRAVKMGFVGAARAGKTSTLRALAGLPLRLNEESTPGLAVWEVSHKLLCALPGDWQLQEARGAAGTARWEQGIAQFVANRMQKPSASSGSSSRCEAEPDASVLKKMPVDLIAHHLGRQVSDAEDAVVLETYDFGGQEVYYAMHHLFLTDHGVYLACIDLTTVQTSAPDEGVEGGVDFMDDVEASAKEHGWEALEWWLASVSMSAPNSPVAIVGTHDDCLEPLMRPRVHQLVHERIVSLCTRIPELNARLHVNEVGQLCFFPIDNSGVDDGASAALLRSAIDAMASEVLSGTVGQSVPLRWAHFWAAWQRSLAVDDCPGKLVRIDEVWKRCSHYGFESMTELHNFLQHFRSIGALLHFPEAASEDLRDLVCLDPAWVADAAASVLLAKDRVLQGCMRHSAELRDSGRLHSELLAAIWRPRAFARHHKQLVELLQVLDLLMPWGLDKQAMPQSQHASAHQVFLVPSLLPMKPPRPAGEPRADMNEEDSIVMYLDFHGLLHRLLPTLFPRVLCAMARLEPAVQILSVYANYATFAFSTHRQAKGDKARSLGGRHHVEQKLIVQLQPCAGGELLRCSLRARRAAGSSAGAAAGDAGAPSRPSWRHADRLLHTLRDAIGAWMPRLSFKAGIRCPTCLTGRAHSADLHSVLRDEVPLCPRSGEAIEDLPMWLADWRSHLRPVSPECGVGTTSEPLPPASGADSNPGIHLDYLYASPLNAAPLDIRAELEVLASLPGLSSVSVRTATTEVLADVWRSGAQARNASTNGLRVLRLVAHCAVDPSGKMATILLEDAIGRGHLLKEQDLAELLVPSPSSASSARPPFDVVILDACNSERLARCFVNAGAHCAVACDGSVFDAAARAFLRAFLKALAVDGDTTFAAFAAAQRAVRLSPQPGLRTEANRFRLLTLDDESRIGEDAQAQSSAGSQASRPPQLTASSRAAVPACSMPLPIEDFLGRTRSLVEIAQAFLNGRRVVWLYGGAGVGKSALATEFCRFYTLPGDRLFSAQPASPGTNNAPMMGDSCSRSVPIVQFCDLSAAAALDQLCKVLQSAGADRGTEYCGTGCLSLLVLDGAGIASAAWWSLLEEALVTNKRLRLLLVSREPRYDAPISCKIVAYKVEALSPEDAATLFLRRVHRPLYPRDFNAEETLTATESNGPSAAAGDAPLAMTGLASKLARHALFAAVGCAPGAIRRAAAEVTPLLPSLFAHSALAGPVATPIAAEMSAELDADGLVLAAGGG